MAPSTLGILGGAARIFTKQATKFLEEGNTPSAGTKTQALHRVLIRGDLMLHNTVGEGNGIGGGTETTAAPTAGQEQGAGREGYRMVSADGGRENVWPSSDNTGVL